MSGLLCCLCIFCDWEGLLVLSACLNLINTIFPAVTWCCQSSSTKPLCCTSLKGAYHKPSSRRLHQDLRIVFSTQVPSPPPPSPPLLSPPPPPVASPPPPSPPPPVVRPTAVKDVFLTKPHSPPPPPLVMPAPAPAPVAAVVLASAPLQAPAPAPTPG